MYHPGMDEQIVIYGLTPGARQAAEQLDARRVVSIDAVSLLPVGSKVLIPHDITNKGDLRTLNYLASTDRIQLAIMSPPVDEVVIP
jgi:hypothetical protein